MPDRRQTWSPPPRESRRACWTSRSDGIRSGRTILFAAGGTAMAMLFVATGDAGVIHRRHGRLGTPDGPCAARSADDGVQPERCPGSPFVPPDARNAVRMPGDEAAPAQPPMERLAPPVLAVSTVTPDALLQRIPGSTRRSAGRCPRRTAAQAGAHDDVGHDGVPDARRCGGHDTHQLVAPRRRLNVLRRSMPSPWPCVPRAANRSRPNRRRHAVPRDGGVIVRAATVTPRAPRGPATPTGCLSAEPSARFPPRPLAVEDRRPRHRPHRPKRDSRSRAADLPSCR